MTNCGHEWRRTANILGADPHGGSASRREGYKLEIPTTVASMNLPELFFSIDGRIGRAKFWLGAFVLAVISAGATYAIVVLIGVSQAAIAFTAAVAFALAYPSYAVMAKRFQDRGKPGALALICLVPAYAVNLLYTFGVLDPVEPSTLARALDAIIALIFLWYLVDLGLLKGTQGPNSYGPDPLGHDQADESLT